MFALVSVGAFSQDTPPEHFEEVTAVLQKLIAARESVQSGHFRLTIDKTITNVDRKKLLDNKDKEDVAIDIIFQGEKQKVEEKRVHSRLFMLVNCLAPETMTFYNPQPSALWDTPDKKWDPFVVVYDRVRDSSKPDMVPSNHLAYEPCRWGIITEDSAEAKDYSLARFFTLKKEKIIYTYPRRCSIDHEVYQGDDCTHIMWEFGPKETINPSPQDQVNCFDFWIIPKKSYIVRKAEINGKLHGWKRSLENEAAEYKQSGLWFPTRWTYHEERQNGSVQGHEECRLEILSMNEPIDPKELTLASIKELKEGTFAYFRTKNIATEDSRQIWNGNEIISSGTFELKAFAQKKNPAKLSELVL
jgi:hypothetical protein